MPTTPNNQPGRKCCTPSPATPAGKSPPTRPSGSNRIASGSIAQLASEAETIAAYAHEVAAAELLITTLGDTPAVNALLDDQNFDRVVTAIRAAHAAGTDVPTVLPRLAAPLQAKGTLTADRLAEVLRTHTSTTTRQHPVGRHLVAGLLPDATRGLIDPQMLQALQQRYQLIENRADAVLDRDLAENAAWVRALPTAGPGSLEWRVTVRSIAAYRDRWDITATEPLGHTPDAAASHSQQADHRRAAAALHALRQHLRSQPVMPDISTQRSAAGREL